MRVQRTESGFPKQAKIGMVAAVVIALLFILFRSGALGDVTINLSLFTNPGLDEGLVAHWTLDGEDTNVMTATDRSGSGFDGTIFTGGNQYNNVINALTPEARYELNGNDGTDATGNGHSASSGSATAIASIIPITPVTNSADFDGSTQEFGIPDAPEMNTGTGYAGTERAISVWINADTIDTTGNGRAIWSQGGTTNSLNMYVFNDGADDRVYCNATESTNIDYVSAVIAENTTYHVGCMWNFAGGRLDMYIDGALVNSDTTLAVGTALASHSGDIGLGGVNGTVDNHNDANMTGSFDGTIADLVYFSDGVVLGASDFEEIYNAGSNAGNLVIGRIAQAASFDGVDDYIDVGNIGTDLNTFSFWVKTSTTTLSIPLIDVDGTDQIETDAGGNVVATDFSSPTIYVNGSSASALIATSTWQHVVVINTSNVSGSDFDIGRIEGEGYFGGVIDDVRVYNRALSADEVERLYHLGATTNINITLDSNPALRNGLLSHWTFDGTDIDISSTTAEVLDRVGGKNGDATNFDAGSNGIAVVNTTLATSTGVTSDSFSHTVSGSNTVLVVRHAWNDTADEGIVTSITYNGVALTQETQGGDIGFNHGIGVWYLVNPDPGTNTLTVNYTGNTSDTFVAAVTLSGVDQTDPIDATVVNYGSDDNRGITSIGVDITTVADEALILDIASIRDNTQPYVATTSNQTLVWDELVGNGANETAGGYKTTGAAGSYDIGIECSPTCDSTSDMVYAVVSFTPAAAEAGGSGAGAGRIGQALSFGGSADHVQIDDPELPTGDFTYAAWVFLDEVKEQTIFMAADGAGTNEFQLDLAATGELRTELNGGAPDATSSGTIATSTWTHVAVTRSGGSLALYIDGAADGTGTDATTLDFSTCAFLVGVDADASCVGTLGEYFNGRIDDARVYNRALSQGEITRLYQLGATTKINTTVTTNPALKNGLVGHWTFDGPDLLQNATDKSGSGNTGYLGGFSATTTVPGKIGQALSFDGADDEVDAGSDASLDNLGSLSVAAWIRPNSLGENNRGRIAEKATGFVPTNGWAFFFYDNNRITFQVDCGAGDADELERFSPNNTITAFGEWMHVAVTWDGSSSYTGVHIYIDGSEISYGTEQDCNGTPDSDASANLRIGADSGGVRAFDGIIDDVRIYNRALSTSEVQRLYELGR